MLVERRRLRGDRWGELEGVALQRFWGRGRERGRDRRGHARGRPLGRDAAAGASEAEASLGGALLDGGKGRLGERMRKGAGAGGH